MHNEICKICTAQQTFCEGYNCGGLDGGACVTGGSENKFMKFSLGKLDVREATGNSKVLM